MNAIAASPARIDPRLIYGLDTLASLVMGVTLLLTAEALTALAGWTLPTVFLFGVGLFLIPWSAFNLVIARSASPNRVAVRANIAGDIIWVAGTLALLGVQGGNLTGLGLLLLAGQGAAVGGVLAMKLLGARQLLG